MANSSRREPLQLRMVAAELRLDDVKGPSGRLSIGDGEQWAPPPHGEGAAAESRVLRVAASNGFIQPCGAACGNLAKAATRQGIPEHMARWQGLPGKPPLMPYNG